MKKWIALLMTLVMLMATAAFAEEAVFNWEIPADAVGETWTTTLKDKNIAFEVFVYEGWEYQDSSTYQPHVRAMWATEDGRTLELAFGSHEEVHVNTIEDAVTMVENGGYSYDIQTVNGMSACLLASEDMLSARGMVAVLPEGVLIVRVSNLTDESQIEEADNMILSITPEKPDVGIKQSELDADAGFLIPITIGNDKVMMYLYNGYEAMEKDDTWSPKMIGSYAMADGRVMNFLVFKLDEYGISDLDGVLADLKAEGDSAGTNKINGLDVISFRQPDDMGIQGIALIMDDEYLLVIKASPIADEAQEAEVHTMFRSLCPAE